jgi:glucose 1-dehydrogenase
MAGKLTGKVALITGSDSGIGQGTAIEFAKEGADIVVHYHSDRDGAEETRRQVEGQGQKAIIVQVDCSEDTQVERIFDEALAAFPTIDILVNNESPGSAGKPVADMTTEEWDKSIRASFYGYFFCCRRFIKVRREAGGGGKIISVTSVQQELASPGGADYSAAKAAIRNLTRSLALEVAEDCINVNNIAPGMILTPMQGELQWDEEKRKESTKNIPWKRAGEPWEIGRMAVYLASDDSDYVTGSSFFIDGGLMLMQGQGA